MKKVLFSFIFLSLFCFTIKSEISSEVRLAIQKSKVDLLEKALGDLKLTLDEKQECMAFAEEILRIRENKMNLDMIMPQKRKTSDDVIYFMGVLFTKCLCYTSGLVALLALIESGDGYEYQSFGGAGGAIFFSATSIASYLAAKKLLKIGAEKHAEFFKHFRTYKQKYLDAFQVKQMFLKLNVD